MGFEDEQMVLVASEIAVAEVRHFSVTFGPSDTAFEDHVSEKKTGSRGRRVLVLEKCN